MEKPELFNRLLGVKFDSEEMKNLVSVKIPDDQMESINKDAIKFPYSYFQMLLRKNDVRQLEETLFKKWKAKLPAEIHQNCISKEISDSPEEKRNCFQSWLELHTIYFLSGNHFAHLIENNKNRLRKTIREKLALLFFQKAFIFENGNTFFQIGEMSNLLLKESLKDISEQLSRLETKIALQVSSNTLTKISEDSLFNDDGFKDVENLQKDFWRIKKDEYQVKLETESCCILSFLDYLIRGIQELQNQGNNQTCIKNIKENRLLESPFRYYFKAILAQNFNSVEAEPEKGNGRIDLKVQDTRFSSPKIIEFKGWWNKDRYNIADQVLGYLTDFEEAGYIIMINHLKNKTIKEEYQRFIFSPKTNYIDNTWKTETYRETNYTYYTSKHLIGENEKLLYHFIFDIFKT
ncbi:MAG: hypothetical protein Q7T79_02200 [bacterium]|nr:hypothetical protein [bacterium]